MKRIYVFLLFLPVCVFGKSPVVPIKLLLLSDSIALPKGISVNAVRVVAENDYLLATTSGILHVHNNQQKWLSRAPCQSLVKTSFTFYDQQEKEVVISIHRKDNVILAFHWDRSVDSLIPISAGEIPSSVDLVTDIQLLPSTSGLKANICGSRGLLEFLSFYDPGWGQLDATVLESKISPFPVMSLSANNEFLCGMNTEKGWWCESFDSENKTSFNLTKQKRFKGLLANAGTVIDNSLLVSLSDNKLYKFDIAKQKCMNVYVFDQSLNIQKVNQLVFSSNGILSLVITMNNRLYLGDFIIAN